MRNQNRKLPSTVFLLTKKMFVEVVLTNCPLALVLSLVVGSLFFLVVFLSNGTNKQ